MCRKEKIRSGNPVFTMTARGTNKPVRNAEWYRAKYIFIYSGLEIPSEFQHRGWPSGDE